MTIYPDYLENIHYMRYNISECMARFCACVSQVLTKMLGGLFSLHLFMQCVMLPVA